MTLPQLRRLLPEPVSGYVLTPDDLALWLIVPSGEEVRNLLRNPSAERDLVGWTGAGGILTITQDDDHQMWGHYCVHVSGVVPAGGAGDYNRHFWYDGLDDLVAGTDYVWSFYIRSNRAGTPFVAFVGNNQPGGGAIVVESALLNFKAYKDWRRYFVHYHETTNATRWLYVGPDAGLVTPGITVTYDLDGMMLHEGTRRETYVDGDQIGFLQSRPDYYWLATPHASESARMGQSRAGGEIVTLDQIGFRVVALAGLGMGAVINLSTPLSTGGAVYQGTNYTERAFTLTGAFVEPTLPQLAKKGRTLRDDIRAARVFPDQPFLFRAQVVDCGEPVGPALDIPCVYSGGLEGNLDNLYQERVSPQFTVYLPYVAKAEGDHALVFEDQVGTNTYNAQRRVNGEWLAMEDGFNNIVARVVYNPHDGRVYYAGNITADGNGIDSFGYIAAWDRDLEVWDDLAGGQSSLITAIAIAPNGDVYVNHTYGAGSFGYRYYDISAGSWQEGDADFDAAVADMAFLPDGSLVFVGYFTIENNNALTAGRVAVRDVNGNYSTYGTGFDAAAVTVSVDPVTGRPYFAGDFTTADGNPAGRAAYWDGTNLLAMGDTGFDDLVWDIFVSRSGRVYAGGQFLNADGQTISCAAIYDGARWAPLGDGLTTSGGSLYCAAITEDPVSGGILFFGVWEDANGVLMGGAAVWNGYAWVPIDQSTSSYFYVGVYDPLGDLYLGTYSASPVGINVHQVLDVDYQGTAPTWPKFIFVGDTVSPIYIENITTGAKIFCDQSQATPQPGETITLMLDPNRAMLVSDWRGDITGAILPGSDTTGFYLQPGLNRIVVKSVNSTSLPDSGVLIQWDDKYESLLDAVRR